MRNSFSMKRDSFSAIQLQQDLQAQTIEADEKEAKQSRLCTCITSVNPREELSALKDAFGQNFLLTLFFIQHLGKGLASNITYGGLPFLLRLYNTPAPDVEIFKSFIWIPWSMKPFVGLLSDKFPVFGYQRLPYMTLATVSGITGAAIIAFLPIPSTDVKIVVAGLFLITVAVSWNDLLTEARYTETLKHAPEHGPSLISFVWGGIALFGLAGTLTQGPVLEGVGAQMLYRITLIPIVLMLLPIVTNWFGDKPLDQATRESQWERLRSQPELIGLTLMMITLSCGIAAVNMSGLTKMTNAIVALTAVVIMTTSFGVFLNPTIGRLGVFIIIQGACCIQIDGAAFYFFTDNEELFPDGPHFSDFFYSTGIHVIVDCCDLAAIMFYMSCMKNWSYRSMNMATNCALIVAHLYGVLIFTRFNRVLGIPDRGFVLTSSAMDTITRTWMWLPQVLLTSQVCPRGSEATVFALVNGAANLGHSCASMIGAAALYFFGVVPSGEPGDADKLGRLWEVALLAALLPAITVCLIPICIPDKSQTEKVLEHPLATATEGSLFRAWREPKPTEGTALVSARPDSEAP